jgi:lipopolysaccharide/colanic/teichoic acid biosynthesis glycosyltransferase
MPNRIVDDITENRQDGFAASALLGRGIPRPVEIVLAILVLVVSAPFIVAAAIAVAVTSRGPAIFRQEGWDEMASLSSL